MGKKIIVRGADFSQNGFTFTEVKKEYTKLKQYHGEDATYPVSAADSWYTCAFNDNPGVLSLDHTNFGNAVSLGVDAEDYTHVKVEGYGDDISRATFSIPIIACVDENNNVLGGIIAVDASYSSNDAIYLAAGWTVIRGSAATYPSTFEMDIPVGTAKIYTSMVMTSETQGNFKMTLSKYDYA